MPGPRAGLRSLPVRVAVIYAVVGALWILGSDRALEALVPDVHTAGHWQTYKGWIFVGLTAAFLYAILTRATRRVRRAWEARQEVENRLQLAVSSGGVGLWDWDLRRNTVHYSKEWKHQLGYADHEIQDDFQEWRQRVHPEDVARAEETVQRYVREPWSDYHMEVRLRHKDGSYRRIFTQAALIHDAAGRPVRMLGTHIDVTALRQAESTLRETEQFNRVLLDTSPDCIKVLDADGRLRSMNRGGQLAREIPDFAAWQGRPWVDLWPPAMHATLDSALRDARATGAGRFAGWAATVGGVNKWWDVVVRRLPELPGRGPQFLVVSRDLTARRQAEEQVQQLNANLEQMVAARTEQLQAKNTELARFTYSVSHDLKAPLRGIDGYSRLLLDDYGERLDGEGRFFVERIREAAVHMGRLIDDLLSYSRVERRAAQTIRFPLRPAVDSALRNLAPEIEAVKGSVAVELEDLHVTGDPDGLQMVLRNLVDNALKFRRADQPPRVTIGGEAAGATCRVWVRDEGIGFDMKFHDRIFEIFQRLERQEEYPGTGIGLAIVRKAMQRMGGRVWAESRPGAGATFFLELPL